MPHSKEKWQSLEERLHAVEGEDKYGLEAANLCLVLDVGLPTNFKTSEFDKYKGSSYPRVHLAMYCWKMAVYIYDDKILIHCFQDSLTGVALNWYINLEHGRIKTWRDLAEAFLKQYKYNEDMAWRELAAQVQPPIIEREMITMFIDTLPSPYYDKVVRNVASNFMELVVVGERIELGIRRGKFAQASNNAGFAKKPTSEKKKGEANDVLVEPVFPHGKGNAPSYPTQIHVGSRLAVAYTNPRPAPYVHPYQPQVDIGVTASSRPKVVEIIPLKPLEPPYLRSYDPNARCDYHGGAIGHATERCWSLKHVVQDFLDGGLLGFQDQGPNVQNNPLPAYKSMASNGYVAEYTMDSTSRVEEGAHSSCLNKVESASVTYIEGNDNPRPKPLIIHYNSASQPRVSFIIQVPTKPVYNNNAVPWRYSVGETTTPSAIKEDPFPEVTNIAGTRGVTRSRRIFASEGLRNKDPTHLKKYKAAKASRRIVTEGEAIEFLKLIHHN
ncbi:hypothetical protein CR513_61155, partial [Mucuna pruriens]